MAGLKEQLQNLIKENPSWKSLSPKKELSPQVKRILHLVPNELRPYIEKLANQNQSTALLNQFQPGQLPLRFSFNTRGGWITPDGKMFIKTMVSRQDAQIRPRVHNLGQYGNDVRMAAFKEGWIRQDWYQPIFSTKFTLNQQSYRKLVFTFDPLTALKNIRNWMDIQAIAKAYTIIMPPGFWYEISLVKYNENGVYYERKRFRNIGAFLIELRNLRNGSKERFEKEQYFNNPYTGI